MVPFKKQPLACALSSLALMVAPSVFAQSAVEEGQELASQNKKALETITVTATRRAASVEDIPYNISAIDQDTLRARNITDTKKLIEQSVSISAPLNGARFNDSVTVRGLNVSPVNANNLDQFVRSTLAYYLDDTPLPHMRYRIKDIARVETLLGPQGTLYGAGSLGGTVRYVTNQPALGETEFVANTSLYQTDYSDGISSDTDFVVNLPLGDSVALRASVAHLDEKGYIDRQVNPVWRTGDSAWPGDPSPGKTLYEDDDWQEVTGGKVAMLWQVNDDLKITVSHLQQDELAHGINGASRLPVGRFCADLTCFDNTFREETPYQYDEQTVVSRYEEFSDREFSLDAITAEWSLGFAELYSTTSRYEDRAMGQGDYADYGESFYGWISPNISLAGSNNSAYMTFNNLYEGFSHETRLISSSGGSLSWVAGFYYAEHEERLRFSEWMPELDQNVSWLDRAAAGGSVNEGYAEDLGSVYQEEALFGEATYAFTDRWDVTLGARVFNYSDEADGEVTDYLGFTSGKRVSEIEGSGESFFKLNTSFDVTADMMVYATASQGFRRGGANAFKEEGGNVPTQEIQFFEPDSVDSFELGIKGYLLDDKLFVHADWYLTNWKDTQTYWDQIVGGYLPINGTTNGPDSEASGIELSANYRFSDNWSMYYQTAKTDSTWAETGTVCTYEDADCTTYESGAPLGGSPDWRHNIGVQFDTVLSNGLGLTASLDGRYVGETPSDRSDTIGEEVYVRDAYSVYDAYVAADFEQYRASLWVNNLANEDAEVSGQRGGRMGYRAINLRPRTLGLNLSYRF